jgi:choline dehydrogenase
MQVLVDGVKLLRSLADTKAFGPFVGRQIWPGPQAQSEEDIREFIRTRAETMYHPVGTCKMGVDAMAVVDPQLWVRRTQGLRVVDASIMPLIVTGNTNAPTIMIGEMGADMIKATHVTCPQQSGPEEMLESA